MKINTDRVARRKRRVSSGIRGTASRPRIAVYRSNSYIYAQAIDDINRQTIVNYSSMQLKKEAKNQPAGVKKTDQARQVGIQLAKLLLGKKIFEAVLDRSRYAYNGRVKGLAEGLREGKLKI